MKNSKFYLVVIVCIVALVSVVSCGSKSGDEVEAQIENAQRLAHKPSYYVENVSANEEGDIIDITLRREEGKADGTFDNLINVTFNKEYNPSAEYIKVGDSIKLDIMTETSETLIGGRYEQYQTHECYLYVFVDQLQILIEKSKEEKNE